MLLSALAAAAVVHTIIVEDVVVQYPTTWHSVSISPSDCHTLPSKILKDFAAAVGSLPDSELQLEHFLATLESQSAAKQPAANTALISGNATNATGVLLNVLVRVLGSTRFNEICKIVELENSMMTQPFITSALQSLVLTFSACRKSDKTKQAALSCTKKINFPSESYCFLSDTSFYGRSVIKLHDLHFDLNKLIAHQRDLHFFYGSELLESSAESLRSESESQRTLSASDLHQLAANEFPFYLALWKVIEELYEQSCENNMTRIGANFFPLLTLHLSYPDDSRRRIGQLLASGRCDFIVVVRGTVHHAEWAANLTAWLVPSRVPDVFMHYGYLQITEALYEPLYRKIKTYSASCARINVVFSGHSLGGAVATQLAALLQNDEDNASIFVFGYGAPPSVSQYNAQIKYRYLIDVKDAVFDIPCAGGSTQSAWPRILFKHALPNGYGADYYPKTTDEIVVDSSLHASSLSVPQLFRHYGKYLSPRLLLQQLQHPSNARDPIRNLCCARFCFLVWSTRRQRKAAATRRRCSIYKTI